MSVHAIPSMFFHLGEHIRPSEPFAFQLSFLHRGLRVGTGNILHRHFVNMSEMSPSPSSMIMTPRKSPNLIIAL